MATLIASNPLLHLRADSPMRPVDWRWQKASVLRELKKEPSRLRDDKYIVQAIQFQTLYDKLEDDWSQLQLSERHPAITNAFALRHAGMQNEVATRNELEARLLARNIELPAIADTMCMDEATVQCYERLFFNVRDRLDKTTYLLHHAVGAEVHEKVSEENTSVLWKLFALCGGVHLLDDMMLVMSKDLLDVDGDPDRYRQSQERSVVLRRSLTSAVTLRARSSEEKLQMMEISARYKEVETAAVGVAGDDRFREGLLLTLNSFKLMLAGAAQKDLLTRTMGAEPRAEQLLLAGPNGDVTIPQYMLDAKFPDLRPEEDVELGKNVD